jgi:hypothetical protein
VRRVPTSHLAAILLGLCGGLLVTAGPVVNTEGDKSPTSPTGRGPRRETGAIGHTELGWPPNGQVGEAVAGDGVTVSGGPEPGFHFRNAVPPGASFRLPQAQSDNAVDHQKAVP